MTNKEIDIRMTYEDEFRNFFGVDHFYSVFNLQEENGGIQTIVRIIRTCDSMTSLERSLATKLMKKTLIGGICKTVDGEETSTRVRRRGNL